MNMRKLIYAAIFCTLLSATCKQTVKDEPGGEYGWKWGDSSSAAWNSDTDSKRNEPPYQPSHASLWDLKHTDLKVRFKTVPVGNLAYCVVCMNGFLMASGDNHPKTK